MGLFKNLRDARAARKEISRNPLYQIVLTHVQKEIHESPHELIQNLPAEGREKVIQEICNIAETIWQAPDRVLANREMLLEVMLAQAQYEILLIEPDNRLCSFQGISGELKEFLPEFVQKQIDSGNFVWTQETKPTKDEAYNLVWGKYWRAYLYCNILNETRIYLKDYNANLERDWYLPLQYALAAWEEYNFRKEYVLEQLKESLDTMLYSTLYNLVLQGHKDPLKEWEKVYNKTFPMPSKI
jgi:hypothetical protein